MHPYIKQMQSLPLDAKIIKSQQRIQEWHDYFAYKGEGMYISFSGGLDSLVLLHITRQRYPGTPAVFCDTGLEYPEVKQYAKNTPNVDVIRPKMSYKEVLERYGYPVVSKEQAQFIANVRNRKSDNKTYYIRMCGNNRGGGKISEKWKYLLDAPFKISEKCCDVMKKNPFKMYEKETKRRPLLGNRAEEGSLRSGSSDGQTCNRFDNTRPYSTPLSFWTRQDILWYLLRENIEIPEIYGNIIEYKVGNTIKLKTTLEQRTGCMFCVFGVHRETQPNKFQRMRDTHPKLWKYCMNQLGLKQVLDYMGIPYK